MQFSRICCLRQSPVALNHGARTRYYRIRKHSDKHDRKSVNTGAPYDELTKVTYNRSRQVPWKNRRTDSQWIRDLEKQFAPGIALDFVRWADEHMPHFPLKLRLESVAEPTRLVVFEVEPSLTRVEIKAYLERVYGFEIEWIRTSNPRPKVTRAGNDPTGNYMIWHRESPVKVAYVYLTSPVCLENLPFIDKANSFDEEMEKYRPRNPGTKPIPASLAKEEALRFLGAQPDIPKRILSTVRRAEAWADEQYDRDDEASKGDGEKDNTEGT